MGIILIAVFCFTEPINYQTIQSKDTFEGVTLVDSDDFLSDKELLTCDYNPGVCLNDSLLPYDASSNTIYVSQNTSETNWIGRLLSSLINYKIYAFKDSMWNDKVTAISTNYTFSLWLVGKKNYYQFNLCITGTPLMSITTTGLTPAIVYDPYENPDGYYYEDRETYTGNMILFDSDNSTVSSKLTYQYKGGSSSSWEKHSYSIKLLKGVDKKNNVSLLGMRSDNSWKLNSLFSDPNYIREMTATKLWKQIAEANPNVKENSLDMRYVELIVDNKYEGIYALVEPVDADKLSLDDNDVLYKSVSWIIPTTEEIDDAIENKWTLCESIRLRYPKNIENYDDVWYPIKDYLTLMYGDTNLDYETLSKRVSLDNLCDYNIFIMLTEAYDNTYKNCYFAARVDDDGSYVMYIIPWDLDGTFGNDWSSELICFTVSYENYEGFTTLEPLEKLIEVAPTKVLSYLVDKWEQYRQNILSDENIIGLLQNNANYLLNCGSYLREQNRWPDRNVSSDLAELNQYELNRMHWLDEYFQELSE
jgi:hypothetical protein